jgi:polyisoprenoid-binding protein YceI
MPIIVRTPSQPAGRLAGTWLVDASDSYVRFTARTIAGLVKVPGRFRTLTGAISLDERSTSGSLVIDTASIDTGNRLRDRHLRSNDFFGAAEHPELRYETRSLAIDGQRVSIDGELLIAGARTRLPLVAELRNHHDGRIEIACCTQLDRFAVGVRGARGMVPRMVELDIAVRLRRA